MSFDASIVPSFLGPPVSSVYSQRSKSNKYVLFFFFKSIATRAGARVCACVRMRVRQPCRTVLQIYVRLAFSPSHLSLISSLGALVSHATLARRTQTAISSKSLEKKSHKCNLSVSVHDSRHRSYRIHTYEGLTGVGTYTCNYQVCHTRFIPSVKQDGS